MKNLLIYYGWLNSFNSATNAWTNEKVAQELAKYDVLVLGDGIADSAHGDYANTKVIIPRIKALNPSCLIFGYVTINQTYASFKTKADKWDNTDFTVDGVFLDEAGYDYGSASTNGRDAFNEKIDYCHSNSFLCFANSWKPDHVLDTSNDASYPNTTWNPDFIESNLKTDDWYLLESLAINSAEAYEDKTQWKDRGDKAREYNLNLAAVSVIADGKTDGADRMKFIWLSASMHGLQAVGSSDTSYGASSAKSQLWARPDDSRVKGLNDIASDGNKHFSYGQGCKLELDFTSITEASSITYY